MLKDKTLTYISLFSCAGVGCFGFKKAGFECIATNELIERRLNVQKYNNKCRFESGYICDDITTDETKNKIFKEIDRWKELGNDRVDVLIATPPCQGMSVANHKKAENEIVRNSLVVESVHLIQKIAPRFFIFENVAAFMKTGCTAPDGTVKAIGDVVYEELSDKYIIVSRILNFKNYGSNSSRTRTVVIGVSKDMAEYVAPIELYPTYVEERTLRDVIGDMPKLEWGEICPTDFYHSFRTYGEKSGHGYVYSIVNQDLLEYISFGERNCYNFLCLYIEKVLRDSGIYRMFEYFFRLQDKNSFKELKDSYTSFTIQNTPINGATECGRIFTKVLNPLACKYKKCGTERGHISKDIITQDKIMYNQRNWRDILSEKPKDMTRVDYEVTLPKSDEDYMTTYRINRAKRNLRRFNDVYRNSKTEGGD